MQQYNYIQYTICHQDMVGSAACLNYTRQFHCFCNKAYYVSNFKDFNTLAPACK